MFPLSKTSVAYGSLLLWIIVLQSFMPISRACIEDERKSLLDFKAGLNLSSGQLSSWRGFNWRGFNCCKWEGVGCDYHTSHVITLDLSNQLSGEIHPSQFDLQHLDFSWNDFQGISIPPQFSKLQRLSFLSLSNAGFSGDIPLDLGNMSRLRHLDLSYDNWESKSLKGGKFGVWVRGLRSLEFLGMNEVNLTMGSERWGEALSGLHNLTQIQLSSCGLSGNIPDLSNLTSLSHLLLRWNSFPSQLPSWLENVSSLVSLDLKFCDLNGPIPSNFMPRSKLRNLDLSGNYHLKVNLSFILGHSSSLVALSLSYCNLSGQFPRSAANYSKIETMEGTIPSSFHSFSVGRINSYPTTTIGSPTQPSTTTDQRTLQKHTCNMCSCLPPSIPTAFH